jgi:hypothetical protein
MAGRAAAIKGILSANKELPQIKAAVERYRQDPKKFELELRGK